MKDLYIDTCANDYKDEPVIPQTKEFKEANWAAFQEMVKKYCGDEPAPF